MKTPANSYARGFTLLEVLAAMAVLAIALSAILAGMARYTDNAAYLNEKTMALLVAHNRLTEIELAPVWPGVGKSDGEMEMAGAKWHWDAEVTVTPDPGLRRIDIRVQSPGRHGNAATLSSFVSALGRKQ